AIPKTTRIRGSANEANLLIYFAVFMPQCEKLTKKDIDREITANNANTKNQTLFIEDAREEKTFKF
ncbi:MAG: hypothetical protein ACRDFB_09440, partial [Rhabdochlamydiaceae bacterium]